MKPLSSIIISLMFLFTQIPAFAQNRAAFPRLEPDPKALEYYRLGRQNQNYSWLELAEISLWASGDTNISSLSNIRRAVETLNSSPELPADSKERAEFILAFMHKNILRSYSTYQTRIDTVFSNGRFNCVSSAVLYMILCKSAGIDTSGVITRDHAFVIVHAGTENIDVETTNSYGFDPGNRREFHDQFGRLTGFSYVPMQNYRSRQTINQIELISLILNNRIADNERQNRFADAVPVAIDRAALLAGDSLAADISESGSAIFSDPGKDLMDRLFNYGATLLRANREEDFLRWAAGASSVYPDEKRWQEIIVTAVNNYLVRLTRGNRLPEARNFLENQKDFLTDAVYLQFDSSLVDAELSNSANRIRTFAEGDAVVNAIVQARAGGKISEMRTGELLIVAIQNTAAALGAAPARDWRAAADYIEAAAARFGAHIGGNRGLEQALRTYRSNLAADYHNRFAAEWNRKNYTEAERILNEGLAEFPGDRQLLNNMEIVKRHNSQ